MCVGFFFFLFFFRHGVPAGSQQPRKKRAASKQNTSRVSNWQRRQNGHNETQALVIIITVVVIVIIIMQIVACFVRGSVVSLSLLLFPAFYDTAPFLFFSANFVVFFLLLFFGVGEWRGGVESKSENWKFERMPSGVSCFETPNKFFFKKKHLIKGFLKGVRAHKHLPSSLGKKQNNNKTKTLLQNLTTESMQQCFRRVQNLVLMDVAKSCSQ